MQHIVPLSSYPGASASLFEMNDLAEAYLVAVDKLLQSDSGGNPLASAPVRLLSIHAIELYLNMFLITAGQSATMIRGFQHDLEKRSRLAIDLGLVLRKRTEVHLLSLSSGREYLTSRYGPECASSWSQLNALIATMKEVSEKVHPVVVAEIERKFAART